jgi:murein DD-endopeptidase MepM/ murein hydrolase activator NlpD
MAGGAGGLLFSGTAAAEPHTVTVTLAGGQVLTITLDLPAGTPLDQIKLPDIVTPIIGVQSATPTQPAPAAPAATATQPAAPAAKPGKRPGKKKPKAQGGPAATSTAPSAAKPAKRAKRRARPGVAADGTPTVANPTFSYAIPGPAPVGGPNFFIDRFRIPPFLLPIYQAAGIQYGVRWEILAAINEIETDYGRNLNVSTAGATGWMQFLPSTWKQYGVDANDDGKKDMYNPADAIFAAARYLKAAGAATDIKKAIFAYNHADWYVDSVLMRARLIGGAPADLIGSLTGLTEGRFPVHATARYAAGRAHSVNVFARAGSPAIAVQDGKVVRIGRSEALGRFVVLRDAYGNTYTYSGLKTLARKHAVVRDTQAVTNAALHELELPRPDAAPDGPATAGKQSGAAGRLLKANVVVKKERLFANPKPVPVPSGVSKYLVGTSGIRAQQLRVVDLKKGSRVVAGTVLGHIGETHRGIASHLRFQIRPAGKGTPLIDPKPILDGWKLLESTAIYRAAGKNPFFGRDAKNPTIGQIMLMSKAALQRRVLTDPNVDVYGCGRNDVRAGAIDRRVLATLEFLSASGLKPTVTSLRCGHGYLTASGNVSEHSSGDAVDIAKINGIPIMGHQGAGSITDITIRRLLTLQGTLKPHQIISLMSFDGTDNTLALPDHADHIHVGFRPAAGSRADAEAVLKPGQWTKLIERLGQIRNPTIPTAGEAER